MENLDFFAESFNQYLLSQSSIPLVFMVLLGLIGGLLSSISPCVLSLLPLNLSYIGTLDIEDKKEAFFKALAFVVGVASVLSLLGAFSNFAFAVFSEYRTELYISVGVFIILMSLAILGWLKLPLPQFIKQMPNANPFVIGLLFALVSSPCASPILFGVLSLAGSTNSITASVLIMFAYSIGYTAIIFFASLSFGIAKQLNWFKENNALVTKISAAVMALLGCFYLYLGLIRFFSSH